MYAPFASAAVAEQQMWIEEQVTHGKLLCRTQLAISKGSWEKDLLFYVIKETSFCLNTTYAMQDISWNGDCPKINIWTCWKEQQQQQEQNDGQQGIERKLENWFTQASQIDCRCGLPHMGVLRHSTKQNKSWNETMPQVYENVSDVLNNNVTQKKLKKNLMLWMLNISTKRFAFRIFSIIYDNR